MVLQLELPLEELLEKNSLVLNNTQILIINQFVMDTEPV